MSSRSRTKRWSSTALQPESIDSTPHRTALILIMSAGVLLKESAPYHPAAPRGSCRRSCCTQSSSGSGLIRPWHHGDGEERSAGSAAPAAPMKAILPPASRTSDRA
eukprot:scaffold33955_cov90-Isochrysis_galbana.AAC.1